MSIQDDLRTALAPVMDFVLAEFPSTVTVTRARTEFGAGNRPVKDDVAIANGTDLAIMLSEPTYAMTRRIFGRDETLDVFGLCRDTADIRPGDKVCATAGPFAGKEFWVRRVVPTYAASTLSLALTRERP